MALALTQRYPMIQRIDDFGMGVSDERPNLPKPHLSNSQRVGYSICAAAYDFERNDKRPRYGSADATRGTITHAGIATTLLGIIRRDSQEAALKAGHQHIDELIGEFKEELQTPPPWIVGYIASPRWKNGPPATVETLSIDCHDALDIAIPALLAVLTPVSIEHGFAIHWQPNELTRSPYPSVGFTDLAAYINATNELAILDCKTGSSSKSLADLRKDDAVVMYAPPIEQAIDEEVRWLTYFNIVFGGANGQRTLKVKFIGEDQTTLPIAAIPYDPARMRRVATHQHVLQRMLERQEFAPISIGWACERCAHITQCEEKYGPTGMTAEPLTLERQVLQAEKPARVSAESPSEQSLNPKDNVLRLPVRKEGPPTPPSVLAEGFQPFVATIDERYGYAPDGRDLYDPAHNASLRDLIALRPAIASWPRAIRQALAACTDRGHIITLCLEDPKIETFDDILRHLAARIDTGEEDVPTQCGPHNVTINLRRVLATLLTGQARSSQQPSLATVG